jgi:hypothetical protein
MKFFSLSSVVRGGVAALKRFPLAVLSGAVGTAASLIMIEHQATGPEAVPARLLFTALIGIPFMVGLTLFAERTSGRARTRSGFQVLGVVLLGVYWWGLPSNPFDAPDYHVIRFWLLFLAAHLFVAVAPYLRRGELNGFWQYNKTLFLRALTTALYAMVLYIGLTIAMAAVEHLFELHVPSQRYQQLFAVIAGLFTPLFFLSGVPENYADCDADDRYPKALKIFTQFVLLPLVTVYLVILYAYMVKIVLTWNWPQGWVANMVLGFSVAGMFSLLLLHPIRSAAENVWIRTFARWFYVALIPLVVLLLLAIGRRVGEYGLTENRYFVIVLGCWLAVMAVLAILRKAPLIRLIPITLGAIAFLASIGPWSASSVSLRDQIGRFEKVLAANGMLVDGKARRIEGRVPIGDARTLSGAVRYIFSVHGEAPLQRYFDADLSKVAGDTMSSRENKPAHPNIAAVMALIGVEYVEPWQVKENLTHTFYAKNDPAVDVTGYELLMSVTMIRTSGGDSVKTPWGTYVFSLGDANAVLHIKNPQGAGLVVPVDSLLIGLEHDFTVNSRFSDIAPQTMRFEAKGAGMRIRGLVDKLGLEKRGDTLRATLMQGKILFAREPEE